MMAKHYCSQFMPQYNKTNLDDLVKQAGVKSWSELFIKKCGVDTEANERWQNPDRPVMEPWVIKDPYVAAATMVTFERNPYYFKVDTAGNQLPYIDKLQINVNSDVQTLVLKVLNGEIDYQDRHIDANPNRAVFIDDAPKCNYRMVEENNSDMNTALISLNLTHQDPVKSEIFNNKDFRIGLSYAIDRKAIINSAYLGKGVPWQAAPRKESAYYNERLAKQYTDYDVAKANEYLDKAYPKKDDQGFRLGPDGKRISFSIMVIPALGDWLDATQLVAQYWQKVGIDAQVQTVDRTLFYDRKDKNQQDATVFRAAAVRLKLCSSPPSTSRSGTSPCSPCRGVTGMLAVGRAARSLRRRSRSRWTSIANSRLQPILRSRGSSSSRFSISPRINFMPLASARRATSMRWSRTICIMCPWPGRPGPIPARPPATPSSTTCRNSSRDGTIAAAAARRSSGGRRNLDAGAPDGR